MRNLEEILKDERIRMIWRKSNVEKATQLKLDVYASYNNKNALIKFTKALGWEHLSVSFQDETPSWDFMQEMKELFWKDDEIAFQLHPKKENYINNHEHCLHAWRPLNYELEVPPTILVGFRKGHEDEDMEELKKVQEELGSPINESQIKIMDAFMKGPEKLEKEINELSMQELLKLL